jgi:hypothetical protein
MVGFPACLLSDKPSLPVLKERVASSADLFLKVCGFSIRVVELVL